MSDKPTDNFETAAENLNQENEALTKEADEVKNQVEKLKNDYLYLKAEFDNYKKHAIKERSELLKYGPEYLAVALLDVVDTFERALETKCTPNSFESYRQGVEMTYKKLQTVLQQFGITEVNSHQQPFDPTIHEAISSFETGDTKPGHIHQVYRKPYKFHEKLIRIGQVIVAKEPSQQKPS